jgi:hypothetical protein
MSTYHPRRLCRPDVLRAIDVRCLEGLLAPYATFLAAHGVTLPLGGREAPLKYLTLAQLFIAPPQGMPQGLVDALYFIDELSTPKGTEALTSAAAAKGIRLDSHLELTPAEIVLRLWLTDRTLVERVHAEMAVDRLRSFTYFQSQTKKQPALPGNLAPQIRAMERELNAAFHSRRYGPYAKILLDRQADCLWLYVGHGGHLRREATVDASGSSSICYRPEVYDALVYVQATGELGIHARSTWETALYQRVFGKHLLGDEQLFSGQAKYTLDPLGDYGRRALACLDAPGIEWARLTELTILEPGQLPRCVRSCSEDLFTSWDSSTVPFSSGARLTSASFRVKLAGCRSASRVTIRPSNRAEYSRDVERQWIEGWLARRGFIRKGQSRAQVPEVLAVA